MRWSEDGSEVTMSKAEYETLQQGGTTFRCHCGWESEKYTGGPFADPPRCPLCECYTGYDKDTYWGTGNYCIVEKRKRYPFLQTVKTFIEGLKYNKVEAYVKNKVMKEFNLSNDEEYTELRGALAYAMMYDVEEFNKV